MPARNRSDSTLLESNDELEASTVSVKKARIQLEDADLGPVPDGFRLDRSGKIKEIQCVNFMCHKNLTVKLGESINFITGPNGSGKSAIVAAIQACFGIRGHETKRSSNLAGLISHDQDDALVKITLYNDGLRAFKRSLYGKVIVIERMLRRNSPASFKLFSETGKSISTRRSDVLEIADHFNIAVNNPCCILDQESSKSFMQGSEEKKYEMFMRATNLLQIGNDYGIASAHYHTAKEHFIEMKSGTKIFEKELKKKAARVKELKDISKLDSQLEEAKRKHVWCLVEEAEQKLQGETARLQKTEERHQRYLLKLEEARFKEASLSQTTQTIEAKQQAMQAQTAAANQRKQEAEMQISQVMKEIKQTNHGINRWNAEILAKEELIKQDQNQIGQILAQTELIGSFAAKETRDKKMRQLSQEMTNGGQELVQVESKIRDLKEELDKIDQRKDELKASQRAAETNFEKFRRRLDQMKGAILDSRARFGHTTLRIIKIIEENADKFEFKPVHIGLNTHLKDMRWAKAVENRLGNVLNRFLLSNVKDEARLRDLCRRNNTEMPNRMISPFLPTRLDVSSKRFIPPNSEDGRGECTTILDVLAVDDDNVFNILVEDRRIEGVALVDDAKAARHLTFRRGSGRTSMPPNMVQCLDKEGNTYYVRDGSEIKDSNIGGGTRGLFVESVSHGDISREMQAMKQAEEEAAHYRERLDRERLSQRDLEFEKKGEEARRKQLNRTMTEWNSQMEELNIEKQEEEASNANFNAARFQARIDKEQDSIGLLREQIAKKMEEVQVLQLSVQPYKDQMVVAEREVEEIQRRWDLEAMEIENAKITINSVFQQVGSAKRKVEEAAQRLMECKASVTAQTMKCQEYFQAAVEFCGNDVRPTERSNLAEIRAEIEQLRKSISEEKARVGGGREEVERMIIEAEGEAKRAESELNKMKGRIDSAELLLRKFKSGRGLRTRKLEDLKETTVNKTDHIFNHNLSHRGYTGSVRVDHDGKSLSFLWKKDIGESQEVSTHDSSQSQPTDMGRLSGGEKSFASLAFLIALGYLTSCPFRVMDEFDVFMDASHRKSSLDLIMDAARREASFSKQYIFVTPHDISQVQDSNDVTKFRMQKKNTVNNS